MRGEGCVMGRDDANVGMPMHSRLLALSLSQFIRVLATDFGSGFRVQGLRLRDLGSGCMPQGTATPG